MEEFGHSPNEIIQNPTKILEEYWYNNVNVYFLDHAVTANGLYSVSLYIFTCGWVDSDAEAVTELRKGLTALELQMSVIDKACSAAPRPELLGHRDIFIWGVIIVQGHLSVSGLVLSIFSIPWQEFRSERFRDSRVCS